MPRYRFTVHDGSDRLDAIDVDLPDIVAARAEGMTLAGELIRDAGTRRDAKDDWRVEIADAAGAILFRMAFVVAPSAAAVGAMPNRGTPPC